LIDCLLVVSSRHTQDNK